MLAKIVVSAAMVFCTVILHGMANAQETFRVTLLGTGSPQPSPQRFGPATLVEVGNQKLLFDAGRGVPIRLSQLRIPMASIDMLFITHYHSDHVIGIPDLWLTAWIPAGGGRTQPFRVIGPTGANSLMANLERAYAADVRIRIADQELPAAGASIITKEFSADGVVYEQNGVRVTVYDVASITNGENAINVLGQTTLRSLTVGSNAEVVGVLTAKGGIKSVASPVLLQYQFYRHMQRL